MMLHEAETLAQRLVAQMAPYCGRIQIAGSIRRRCAEVRDLEIVAVPLWEPRLVQDGLWEMETQVNLLHEWALAETTPVRWVKPGTPPEVIIKWKPKADGRYWRGITGNGVHLDLFLARPDNWGLILAIRTGCREFSTALVQYAAKQNLPSQGGYLRRGDGGEPIPTPEEATVFALLDLEHVAPEHRTGPEALRRRRSEPAPAPAPITVDPYDELRAASDRVYQLARRLGYPDVGARYRGVEVLGSAVWGYYKASASLSQLAATEAALQRLLAERSPQLRDAA